MRFMYPSANRYELPSSYPYPSGPQEDSESRRISKLETGTLYRDIQELYKRGKELFTQVDRTVSIPLPTTGKLPKEVLDFLAPQNREIRDNMHALIHPELMGFRLQLDSGTSQFEDNRGVSITVSHNPFKPELRVTLYPWLDQTELAKVALTSKLSDPMKRLGVAIAIVETVQDTVNGHGK